MPTAVRLDEVSVRFVLHHQRPQSFQDAFVGVFRRDNQSNEEFWALRNVSFEVHRGETLGIIGHNGSGKSTILKLITRILEPSRGKVWVDGKVSALIELGAGFHPDLTGRENIYLNGSILGLSRRAMDRLFDGIVEFAELERFIDTPVKHYSSGMYARLGFSVAISVDPDILIIDEVLSVGDEAFQRKCLERIVEFRRQGKTIIFVSHGIETVVQLCDRVLWLDHGTTRGQGDAVSIIQKYISDVRQHDGPPDGQISVSSGQDTLNSGASVVLKNFRVLSPTGEECNVADGGSGLTIRFGVQSTGVESLEVKLDFYREDGVLIYGTTWQKIDAIDVDGAFGVQAFIPHLAVLGGRYYFLLRTRYMADGETRHLADQRHSITIRSASDGEGLLAMETRWAFDDLVHMDALGERRTTNGVAVIRERTSAR